jgi:cystathionine beta-lyase
MFSVPESLPHPTPDGRYLSSSKWRRFAPDVLPMHVAEMDYQVSPEVVSRISELALRSDLGYLGPIPELEPAFLDFSLERWGWQPAQPRFRLATDVGVAAVELLRALVAKGDGVVISPPVYSSFQKWIHEVGADVVEVPLLRSDDEWLLDLPAIEKAFLAGHRVYLLCHPQNPVGRIHTAAELTALAELAERYEAVVISDEIHAPLAWDDFSPFLSLGSSAQRVGITITSSSKAWNTAGVKAAFVLTEGPRFDSLLAKLPEAMHWRTSLLGAFAMVESFKNGRNWLDRAVADIQANFDLLRSELANQLPLARLTAAKSTYLAWIDLASYGQSNWAPRLLGEQRLSVVAGADHASAGYHDFIRLNIATHPDWIRDAVGRIAQTAKHD